MNDSFYKSLDRDADRCMHCKNPLPINNSNAVCCRCENSKYKTMPEYVNSKGHYDDCMCHECMKQHMKKDIIRHDILKMLVEEGYSIPAIKYFIVNLSNDLYYRVNCYPITGECKKWNGIDQHCECGLNKVRWKWIRKRGILCPHIIRR